MNIQTQPTIEELRKKAPENQRPEVIDDDHGEYIETPVDICGTRVIKAKVDYNVADLGSSLMCPFFRATWLEPNGKEVKGYLAKNDGVWLRARTRTEIRTLAEAVEDA